MENIIIFLAQPLLFIINLVINIKVLILTNYVSLKHDVPEIVNILNYLKECLLIYLQGYNLFFTLRFVLAWFPNINPFIQPYYIVRVVTQPLIDKVDERLPKVFGYDLAFFLSSLGLSLTINYLTKFKFR